MAAGAPVSAAMPPEKVAEFKEVFTLFDTDKSGTISSTELGTVMRALGQNPTEAELFAFIAEADRDNTGVIEFAEFATIMAKYLAQSTSADRLIEAFREFDRDRTGYISVAEFRHINEVGDDKWTEDILEGMIGMADPEGVGRFNYEEFVVKLMAPSS